ncbi:MAG: hypothetical protein ACRDHL_03995, partial [Candidatus Promineifilaceae bacterium]
EWAGDVRFVAYGLRPQAAAEMQTPAGWRFGDQVELLGYSLGRGALAPGDILPVSLFWRAGTPLQRRYKVFLHLLAEDGRLVAQRDAEPGGGLAPTTGWRPGETVTDRHGVLLPAGLPAGRYRLLLGLYPLEDPAARLPLAGGGAAAELGWVEVEGGP